MIVTRKLAAILVADIVGYSRLAGADEDRVLARLRALRSDLIDPSISVHNGRVVKRTGDGVLVEFRSVVDAVRCGIEMQNGLIERNAGVPADRQIRFRIGIHLGDVVEEADGDLMGDGVNIAARLEGIATPGAIALSEDAYRQVRGRIEFAVSDLGMKALKNIAEPLRVYSLQVGVPAEARPAPLESPPQRSGPERCSLVVLPLASLGGGEEHEAFVDGVTESLTTDLSRLSNTVVVARNTAFTYKGKPVDAKQVGRELNVRYILEGSIQRGAGRMRINTQLIDAATGNHIWADRFDKPVADSFDMQDEIVSRLANQLRAELIAAEARRAELEPNPDAIDYYFRGVAAFNKGRIENILRAKELFQEALKLNPAQVDAIVGAARADVIMALYRQEERAERLKAAESELLNALAIDPRSHWAHLWLGYVQILTNRASRGVGELERAMSLNRNIGVAHAWMGLARIMQGRAEETEAHVAEAFRISPTDGVAFLWKYIAGLGKLFLGADAEAAELFRQSIDASRNFPLNHFHNAAALGLLGRQSEAESEVEAGLAIAPGFTLAGYRAAAESDNPVFLAQRERVIEGMRKAGVPEG
ncbi:TolB-like protein [Roseiarcus fermentans]|uniref:TolB-like protein n=1 Tax=Roseiarcus fermentans TaxID=1473586 RepID=A0A366FVQ2_9HYPH|nr:adenylate/guanylate cyclase domain-containing protein [Roseiarcus fermentans]RBP18226.1 TolB-like protein [Roseiarcus fermentans]